jgi:hypothetical protein
MDTSDQHETDSAEGNEFAHEQELRDESEREPLGGCDVEHCQRMHE